MDTTKEMGTNMKSLPKVIAFLVIAFIAFMVGRRILRSYCATYIDNELLCRILGLDIPSKDGSEFAPLVPKSTSNTDYNFGRLVHLIEESIEVKHLFYAAYLEQPKRRKYVDIDAMKDLLSELYREKIRLDSYISYLKSPNQNGFTDKRERSLYYFKKVLAKNIKEIESILKKI